MGGQEWEYDNISDIAQVDGADTTMYTETLKVISVNQNIPTTSYLTTLHRRKMTQKPKGSKSNQVKHMLKMTQEILVLTPTICRFLVICYRMTMMTTTFLMDG